MCFVGRTNQLGLDQLLGPKMVLQRSPLNEKIRRQQLASDQRLQVFEQRKPEFCLLAAEEEKEKKQKKKKERKQERKEEEEEGQEQEEEKEMK